MAIRKKNDPAAPPEARAKMNPAPATGKKTAAKKPASSAKTIAAPAKTRTPKPKTQSRADAAVCSGTLVFALPGSTGAVRTAVEKILIPQLDIRQKPCNFAELLPRIRG